MFSKILYTSTVALTILAICGTVSFAQEKPEAPPAHGEAAAHGGGHTAHIGQEGVSEDPGEFKSDLAIYTFVVFFLLLALLYKFAWGPISEGRGIL